MYALVFISPTAVVVCYVCTLCDVLPFLIPLSYSAPPLLYIRECSEANTIISLVVGNTQFQVSQPSVVD